MDGECFLGEVERQLRVIFGAIRDGHRPPEILKHRCEGFMRAGVFMGVVKNRELSDLMEAVHLEVVGMTIGERVAKQQERWGGEEIDYSQFEPPAYERARG
jgi:hypothetical protein